MDVLLISDTACNNRLLIDCFTLLSVESTSIAASELRNLSHVTHSPSWVVLLVTEVESAKRLWPCLCQHFPDQKVVLVVEDALAEAELFALDKGCVGALKANYDTALLVKAFHTLFRGGLWYSRKAIDSILTRHLHNRRLQGATVSLDALTPKELQIATLSCQGLANKEIANQLYLSPNTVKTHMQRILKKMSVSNRTQLANLLQIR